MRSARKRKGGKAVARSGYESELGLGLAWWKFFVEWMDGGGIGKGKGCKRDGLCGRSGI